MSDVLRLLLTLTLSGFVLTVLCGIWIWYMEEERRIRRALTGVLGAAPEAVVVAHGRGRGAGFSFKTGLAAVAWDSGEWLLVYRIDELVGAELIADGVVVARAFRGEPRRALDVRTTDAGQVTLRLVFDDPKDPDFELDLWISGDDARRAKASSAQAMKEAHSWMSRAEAIFRRPLPPHPQDGLAVQAEAPAAQPAPPPPAFRPASAPPPMIDVTPSAPAPEFAQPADKPPWDEIVEEDIQDAVVEEIDPDEDEWDEIPRRL